MLRFLADENLNAAIMRGLERNYPEIDIVRVQDLGLSGAGDVELLKWAASEKRVLVTHDKRTIPKHLIECWAAGVLSAGAVIIPREFILTVIVEQLAMIALRVDPQEVENQCWRLPL